MYNVNICKDIEMKEIITLEVEPSDTIENITSKFKIRIVSHLCSSV